ncbi:MAG: hypothetical protein RL764_1603 [Pseudomonadota bacterium]|jgi:hypothetical protein
MIIEFSALLALAMADPENSVVKGDIAPATQDAGEMICRRYKELGSRLTSKKVCKTAKEWDDARKENAEVVRQQRGAVGGPQPGNGG